MDSKTEALILQLQINDINALLRNTTNKDEILSLKAIRQELTYALNTNHDHQLAERLDPREQATAALIAKSADEAGLAAKSYELIRQTEPGMRQLPTPHPIRTGMEELRTVRTIGHRRTRISENVLIDLAAIVAEPARCSGCFERA